MIYKSLILFSLFFACSTAFAKPAGRCDLEKLPLDLSFDFKYFVKKERRQEISSIDFLKALSGQWLPLLGKHSDANLRLLFQKNIQSIDQKNYIEQNFFYLNFIDIDQMQMGLLNFGIHSKQNLNIEEPTFTEAEYNHQTCQSPNLIEWTTKNPLLPGTKLSFKYFGPMQSEQKSKAAHIEIYFPEGTKIRLVKRAKHIDFGLYFSEDLFYQDDEYSKKNIDFREASGSISLQAQNFCPKLDELKNSQENLGQCLLERIEDKSVANWKISLHVNQRNARSMTRLNLFPPDHLNLESEFYAGLSSLSYNKSPFLSDSSKRSYFLIRVTNEGGPQYTDIDQNRVPSVGAVNGDGNWDHKHQFLNISISKSKDLVEVEYLEKIAESPQEPGKRIIRAFFGRGHYNQP